MREKTLQSLFENFLIKRKIPYEREYPCYFGAIDFMIQMAGKSCGVEVKSLNGKLYVAIGQLILAQKTFSHVYLLAPDDFIQEIEGLMLENGVLNNIGLITFKEGEIMFIKEPSSKFYYFNPDEVKKTYPKSGIKHMLVLDIDLSILNTFQDKIFDYNSLLKETKISRSNAHQRIKRLLRMGLIEEISPFHPKQYRVKSVPEWGTKVPVE
jgi:hypothetical protein